MAYVLIPEVHRKSKLHAPSEKGIFLGYANDFSTYRILKIETKTVCHCRDVNFDESMFPSLTNESIDQQSFHFNPFDTLMDEEEEEPEEFRPFPEQETPATDESDVIEDEAGSHQNEPEERREIPELKRPAQEI
ncbi:hypothetical protein MJO29_013485 [Puccinia striiformis f. sp. tritici]|nr:hypothetical protein MJO29_013485 [Puccinia striiformis f. sp. tritici]